ncbi:MAG: hypothetical protein BWY84_01183 [Candidatus Aerophobetes bacterium ADurb.Bin490]|nr:MAG: hypothetical protein BWY84_01183 [Candidatus Aerophobetes bacterium ADurb.Bin490]HPI02986.1 hypothetical protein [Candidatus Goldiibacteriota bacterium]HRQ45142.1 hypothetical protein [Candidatus Goldiibacteriota bacterium]
MIKSLHIGQGICFGEHEIIGVFSGTGLNKDFADKMKSERKARNESEKQKSMVLVERNSRLLLYFSRINAGSLIKRAAE